MHNTYAWHSLFYRYYVLHNTYAWHNTIQNRNQSVE